VVGGGPAGMEAARVAALRGHDVTLYERSSVLGGLVPLAGLIKGLELEDLPSLLDYLKNQLAVTGVKVELGKEVTADFIKALGPDAVILATGGVLQAPDMAGTAQAKKKVVTTPELHKQVKPYLRKFGPRFLGWATHYYLPGMGNNVVVVGAGLHGLEVAEYLVKRGRKVTVVEPSDVIGEGVMDFRLGLTMDWFAMKGVTVIPGAKNLVVTDKGVAFDGPDGKRVELAADTVMPTAPLKANDTLYKTLEGMVPELYLIGDGKEAGMMVHAIRAGYQTSKAL
jgi:2,4-dienoyl-CoA reductase (NADPH2)